MIDAVKNCLAAACSPPLVDVFGAAEFAALKGRPPSRMPAAYVIPLSDRADPSAAITGMIRQRVTEQVAVVLAISSTGKPHGDVDQVQALRTLVRDALLGLEPGTGYLPLEYQRGGLVDFIDGVVWWQIDFRTEFQLRKTI